MPKLLCRCGFVHNMSPIPDRGYVVVLDEDYETLTKVEAERQRTDLHDANAEERLCALDREVSRLTARVYECPHCRRLAWLEKDGEAMAFYTREA
jgi:hypothetical protein